MSNLQSINLNVDHWDMLTPERHVTALDYTNYDLIALCDDISSTNSDDDKPWNYNELASSGKWGMS